MNENIVKAIKDGNVYMGIEFGSTRIKAVLIDSDGKTVASGAYDWENKLVDGVWTYDLEDVWKGVRTAYAELAEKVKTTYGTELETLGAIGISGMMHGYLPFDKDNKQLAGFRTWRNTITETAAAKLTELFNFNIPQRWSIAHLYQAVLNKESHINDIAYITTLAGYVHKMLTGENVLGVGEASGVFPIDSSTGSYDVSMTEKLDKLLAEDNIPWKTLDVLPKVLSAGENGGVLTEEGAKLLDPSGKLKAGIPLCPPEGDAGTGMVATNSVAARTCNISAGTSIFAMAVLEKPLSSVHIELDIVATPDGKPVAMVHCNTCTSDLDAWVKLFGEMSEMAGAKLTKPALYDMLYEKALTGDPDCGGLVSFNYYAGEPITATASGCPLFTRPASAKMNMANFMRTQIYSTVATLRIGMDMLSEEGVKIDTVLGHGGLFKTPVVGQKFMAGALNMPVSVMETAGEGGPWGVAVLALYMAKKNGETLDEFLNNTVFSSAPTTTIEPDSETVDGFEKFLTNYKACIPGEKALSEVMA